jgi:hypothetical protein
LAGDGVIGPVVGLLCRLSRSCLGTARFLGLEELIDPVPSRQRTW